MTLDIATPAPGLKAALRRIAALVLLTPLVLSNSGPDQLRPAFAPKARPVSGPQAIELASDQVWPGNRSNLAREFDGGGRKAIILLRGSVTGARINSAVVTNAYRAIETDKAAQVSDLIVDGLHASVERECFRVRGDHIVIRNTHCTELDPPRTKHSDLPEGLHIEQGNDIRIEHSSFIGFQMVANDALYWNGDGVAAERGVTGLEIRDVIANDNTDGGFDIKPPVTMDNVSASGNCRNFRFWSDSKIGTMTVGDTIKRGGKNTCFGIWIKGTREGEGEMPTISIERLVVRMSRPTPIIHVQDGAAEVRIAECDIQAPAESGEVWMPNRQGRLVLGKGCQALRRVGPDRRQ
jgi:hypothetical protein